MQSVFVINTTLLASKNYFCKEVFVIILAAMVIQNNKKSVAVSVTFKLLTPGNYESVTFGQF